MKFRPLTSRAASIAFATLLWASAAPALAQTPATQEPASAAPAGLPTAPASERAGNGGYTSADASQPGEGGSPLEPYLFLTILAGGGIIAGIAGVLTDRRLRIAHGYRARAGMPPGGPPLRAR